MMTSSKIQERKLVKCKEQPWVYRDMDMMYFLWQNMVTITNDRKYSNWSEKQSSKSNDIGVID